MTIHTNITVEDGLQSSNTMIRKQTEDERSVAYRRSGKSGTKHKGTEKREAVRRELSALSRHLKGQRDLRVAAAMSEHEALTLSLMSVNDLLIEHYMKKTGAKAFHKFKEWKKLGYRVKKGETAFRVWAAPTRATRQGEAVRKDGAREDAECSYEFFPMCCLFSDLQVQTVDDSDSAASDDNRNNSNEAIH